MNSAERKKWRIGRGFFPRSGWLRSCCGEGQTRLLPSRAGGFEAVRPGPSFAVPADSYWAIRGRSMRLVAPQVLYRRHANQECLERDVRDSRFLLEQQILQLFPRNRVALHAKASFANGHNLISQGVVPAIGSEFFYQFTSGFQFFWSVCVRHASHGARLLGIVKVNLGKGNRGPRMRPRQRARRGPAAFSIMAYIPSTTHLTRPVV